MNQIDRLLGIMQRLRDPENGCPWDKEQTFATIAPYTLEETYEVLDAIAREDFDDLRGELGGSAVPGGVLRPDGSGRRALQL
ncbi:MazG nucleotide pyrophosphohydrolase domain-containing protein [Citrobacter freundii]|nr:MazG nucleotide pyrophosphohydrolase domain-containing protein [Citrobacter freundii]